MEFFSNFSWAVPQAFSDAVALCRFEEGDVLYDTPKAYDSSWCESLKHITYSLQVRYPTRATSSEKEKVGGVFEKNWDSEVRIELYKKQEKVGIGQITTTQGRLYTAIWKGNLTVLENDTEAPPLPFNVKNVTKQLKELKEIALAVSAGYPIFAMARDRSNQVSREKYLKIYAMLKKHLAGEPKILTPENSGLKNWDAIAPTIEIAFFPMNGINREELESLVKKAVYVPSNNTKKDMFRIGAHGVVFE